MTGVREASIRVVAIGVLFLGFFQISYSLYFQLCQTDLFILPLLMLHVLVSLRHARKRTNLSYLR